MSATAARRIRRDQLRWHLGYRLRRVFRAPETYSALAAASALLTVVASIVLAVR